MAQNWLIRVGHGNTSVGQHTNSGFQARLSSKNKQLIKRAKIQGSFNTGFPVQACLYRDDKENGFVNFAKLFDNNVQDVKGSDIGFSRLLVLKDKANEKDEDVWISYSHWKKEGKSNRFSPFTRVKLQVVLTKAASELGKLFFKATLNYGCERGWIDVDGPSFQVLFSEKTLSDLTKCGAGSNELSGYYKSQLGELPPTSDQPPTLESSQTSEKALPRTLKAAEFEPTYWFGEYEIPGLKPLFSNYFWEGFKRWKRERQYRELSYFFKLAGNLLILDHSVPVPSNIIRNSKDDIESGFDEIQRIKGLMSHIKYGIDDNNTYGIQAEKADEKQKIQATTKPFILFDGLGNKNVVLNEADLLIESFVRSRSAKKKEGIEPFFDGNIQGVSALHINNKFEFFGESSLFDTAAPEITSFDWSKEQPSSIYVAIFADKVRTDEYSKMNINIDNIIMKLSLGIQGHINTFKVGKKGKGPSYLSRVMHVADISSETNIQYGAGHESYANDAFSDIVFTDLSDKRDEGIKQFTKSVLNKVKEHPSDFLTALKNKRKLYVVRFVLQYTSPTGKKVSGLRPFGPIISNLKSGRDKDRIMASMVSLSGFTQEGLAPDKAAYKCLNDFQFNLPEGESYYDGKLPWTAIEPNQEKVNPSAQADWLEKRKADEKKKWLKEWIEKQSETLSAPEEDGIS